ncbi:membrane dipeptidase-domain-containing protein [Phaeosphaeriaceae sp. PMI808]|nr:membrane dipeptidase-domain-containing protein [Phaeosphaeriaceae sp. PMI808]
MSLDSKSEHHSAHPNIVHRSYSIVRHWKWKATLVATVLLLLFAHFVKYGSEFVSCHIGSSGLDHILSVAPLIDGHNDFAIWIRAFYNNHIYQDNFTDSGPLFGQVDFPRLQAGRVRGQFWSAYVECPKENNNYSDKVYQEIVHDTLQQIDLIHRLMKEFPNHLTPAYSSHDVWANFRQSNTISSLIGIEGLHQIGNSASILRLYHQLGVRYATLTHTCHNKYADSEEPIVPLHHGLSPAGKNLIREMNRIGMMIDLSHTSEDTMLAAIDISTAPLIFSHSNAFAICNHTRNVPDDVLFRLRDNGGIVMATFYPEFVRCDDPRKASLSDVADHIVYIGQLIGYKHVGIGSDFDGMQEGPNGLQDVSRYPALIQHLLQRGVPDHDLEGIVGGNVLRVLELTEREARRLQDIKPLEDDVKPFF